MRPPAPMTPTRRVSFAPRTRVDARAVNPPAMRKLRRSSWCCMASILATRGSGGKYGDDWDPSFPARERPPLRVRLPPFRANATIPCSMSLTDTHQSASHRPRVGIPWRTSAEEDLARTTGQRGKTEDYLRAVEKAGGEGVVISLKDQKERDRLIPTLDAFVLPGSPADVDPQRYGSANRGLSEP